MRIRKLLWDKDRLAHITKHGVEKEEVEEACWGPYLILRGKGDKYQLLGQTLSGRYLFVVLAHKGGGNFKVVTARDMSQSERRRFRKRKR